MSIKILVQNYLYARRDPSTQNSPLYYREPGYVLDVDDIKVDGTIINGNSIWFHNCQDGCWYWSGGTCPSDEVLEEKTFTKEEIYTVYQCAINELNAKYSQGIHYKGMAIGIKQKSGSPLPNHTALIFFVANKYDVPFEAKIPAVLPYRGVNLTTDIVETIGASLSKYSEADVTPAYPMGGSLSEDTAANNHFGTRTIVVRKDNINYLLTCFHVACRHLMLGKSAKSFVTSGSLLPIVTPSRQKSPHAQDFVVGRVIEGRFDQCADYALIDIDLSFFATGSMPNMQFTGYYSFEEITSGKLNGRLVTSFGAATNGSLSPGTIIAYSPKLVEVDATKKFQMKGLLQATKISTNGDSGAPVVDLQNGKLIGYVIADSSSTSYIMPFANLINDSIITTLII